MTERRQFEQPHRALDAVPVVVMFHMHDGRVPSFLNVPSDSGLLDGKSEHVAFDRKFTIDDHCSTSGRW